MMGTRFLCFAGGIGRSLWPSFKPAPDTPLTPAAGPPVLISGRCDDKSVGSKVDGRARAEAAEPDVRALTTHGAIPLKRTLSAISLLAPGIGATVGAGIVV
jgi:hypothetical protein